MMVIIIAAFHAVSDIMASLWDCQYNYFRDTVVLAMQIYPTRT